MPKLIFWKPAAVTPKDMEAIFTPPYLKYWPMSVNPLFNHEAGQLISDLERMGIGSGPGGCHRPHGAQQQQANVRLQLDRQRSADIDISQIGLSGVPVVAQCLALLLVAVLFEVTGIKRSAVAHPGDPGSVLNVVSF